MASESGETYALGYAGVSQKAPDAQGIYTIYSAARWIYIGESDDIRRSLFAHLNEAAPCMQRFGPLSFSFELVAGVERTARCRGLVAAMAPACNNPGTADSTHLSQNDATATGRRPPRRERRPSTTPLNATVAEPSGPRSTARRTATRRP